MERIPTALGRLAVHVTGSGPPAVLWHSFFVDSRTWQRVIPSLSEVRTVIAIDGPGFGDSDPMRAPATIADCAAAALEVLRHLHVEPVDWVGNAWGGHVGIALAAAHPDVVRSLVAIGAPVHRLGANGGSERRQVQLLRPVARIVGFPGPLAGAVLRALLNDRTRATDQEAVDLVLAGLRRPDRRSFDFAVRSFTLDRPDLTATALSVSIPVLFAAGDDRGEWTPEQSAAVTDRMAHASTIRLAGIRGIAPLEAPEAVITAIRRFWADQDRTVRAPDGAAD